MTDEIWRIIRDFPAYEVSNLGRVRSNKRAETITLKPWLHKSGGYPAVKLSVRGAPQQTKLVHQLVCRAFHGGKPTWRHEVAHEDGVPTNVRADNLSWKLPVENSADKIRHGTHINSGQFVLKMTDDQVRQARAMLARGIVQHEIAQHLGVAQMTISNIKTGRRYAHVK